MRWIAKLGFIVLFFMPPAFTEEIKMVKEESPIVTVETTVGTFEVKLFPKIAPKACENFLKLAEKGYYEGTVFHRVIQNFMIQGGDPLGNGTGGESIWGRKFEDECTKELQFTKPGLLAMANAGPNTNGSQFFITTVETPWLNMKHTIFGEVTQGYDVIKKIEKSGNRSDASRIQIIKISQKP